MIQRSEQPRPFRRQTIALFAAALISAVVFGLESERDQPEPSKACTGPEHRQFDFWIGEWIVETGGKRAGTNRIERIPGGCGLQEHWTSAGGGSGRSLNAYSAQDGRWHQAWIGADGLWLQLAGGLRGSSMVMQGETAGRDGPVRQRITWTPRDDGTVRQLWEQSRDDGRTWSVAFDGTYSKAR